MLNVDLRSTLLTLDIVQARLTLYSFNRNVNLLTVNSRFVCAAIGRSKSLTAGGGVYGATGCTAFLSGRL